MKGQLQQHPNFWSWRAGLIKRTSIVLGGLAVVCCVAGLLWWLWRSTDGIASYAPTDRTSLTKIFHENEYLLLDERATHFSLDHMFDKMAPSYDYPDGSLTIKVYRQKGTALGLVTYHRKSALEGRVQFLLVDQQLRGKGIGKKLLNYAIDDLRGQGFQYVVLSVRAENLPALKLYQSLGFEETSRTADGFIQMSKQLRGQRDGSMMMPDAEW